MKFSILLAAATLVPAAFVAASPAPLQGESIELIERYSHPSVGSSSSSGSGSADTTSNANCERQTYRIQSTANRTMFNLDKLVPQTNQSRFTELFVEYVTGTQQFMQDYITGTEEHTHTFDISGIYCEPKNNPDSSRAIQLLVHGIGFDSDYWNLQANGVPEDEYSYVYQAAKQGISTFRYDRLGTGQSFRPTQGYNVAQASTEIGILSTFAKMLKTTNMIGGKKWDKTLLIGHSYGSVQSNALSKMSSDAVDGIILTGFSSNSTGLPFYLLSTVYTEARMVFPDRLGNAPPDWLVTATPYSGQQNFLYPAFVTQAATQYNRNIEQPVTQGGLFTIGTVGGAAPDFKGPVLVLTGDKDFIFTFDQPYLADGTSIAEKTAKTLYPNSRNATFSIPKNTGHAINFHTTTPGVYQTMLDFARVNNL